MELRKYYFCRNISDMPAIYSIADVVVSISIEPEALLFQLKDVRCANQLLAPIMEDQKILLK